MVFVFSNIEIKLNREHTAQIVLLFPCKPAILGNFFHVHCNLVLMSWLVQAPAQSLMLLEKQPMKTLYMPEGHRRMCTTPMHESNIHTQTPHAKDTSRPTLNSQMTMLESPLINLLLSTHQGLCHCSHWLWSYSHLSSHTVIQF